MRKNYRGYRDLKVYQMAYQLALDIQQVTKTFPKEEKYSLNTPYFSLLTSHSSLKNKMKKVLTIFGTRPEAIKMAPVIQKLKAEGSEFEVQVCVTAQHRQMLDQVLDIFEIMPDYDLNIMRNDQSLFDITTKGLTGIGKVLEKEKPDMVLVQGDTTTTFVGGLAAFYLEIPVGHIEAGLRTNDKHQPFPEEINRRLTSQIAELHFPPTEIAKQNLLAEGISKDKIFVTGNTVIDALMAIVSKQKSVSGQKYWTSYFKDRWNLALPSDSSTNNCKLILVTGHRRENFGRGFENICYALKEIAEKDDSVVIVYPVHLNPNVQKPVCKILGSNSTGLKNSRNIHLIDPLDYEPFVYLMNRSYLILTDSGGVQEEAPSLGIPVLVMRNVTERPEGTEAGMARLVGTDKDRIVRETQRLLNDSEAYAKMANASNPYGDGKAAEKIVNILKRHCR